MFSLFSLLTAGSVVAVPPALSADGDDPVSLESVDVSSAWPDGSVISASLRVYGGLPSYVLGSVDAGGGTVAIGAWGDNPRTMTFSHTNFSNIVLS